MKLAGMKVVSKIRKRNTSRNVYRPVNWSSYILTALLAFMAGGAVTWSGLRGGWLPGGSGTAAAVPPAVSSPAAPLLPPNQLNIVNPSALGHSAGSAAPNAVLLDDSKPENAVLNGNRLYDTQRWQEAIQQYKKAIAGGVDNSDVRTDLGNCFRFTGDFSSALEQYRIAQALNPDHENSAFNTATLYTEALKDIPKATEAWRAYLEKFPTGHSAPMAKQFLSRFAPASPSGAGDAAGAPQPTEKSAEKNGDETASSSGAKASPTPLSPEGADAIAEWMRTQGIQK